MGVMSPPNNRLVRTRYAVRKARPVAKGIRLTMRLKYLNMYINTYMKEAP